MATKTKGRATSKSARKTSSTRGESSPTRPSAGISRIDQPARRTHGYFVRVGYKRSGDGYRPQLSSFFGDVSNGGKRSAWEAAEKWAAKARRDIARGGTKRGAKSKAR